MLEDGVTPTSPVVELEHGEPQPQRRLTIAFRMILVIPHWVWLYLLGIALGFALIGAWFAALFTARVPEGLHTFIARVIRYATRVVAYLMLLTDRYPSFALDAEGYDVELLVPPPGRLNRAAVFFRYFLAIPAAFLAGIVGAGLYVAMFFIWLIVLVKGRMPRSLHQALLAVLRYSTRTYAYYALLTSEYPHRLYGDQAEVVPDAPVEADLDLASAPPPTGAPLAEPPRARTTRLVLVKAARRLVTLFIVLAVVFYVGIITVGVVAGSQGNDAADKLEARYEVLNQDLTDYATAVQSCGIQGGAQCVHDADHDLRTALEGFQADLRDISYPRNALGQAHALEDDTDDLIAALQAREQTEDVAKFQSLSAQFQDAAKRFDQDYSELVFQLRF